MAFYAPRHRTVGCAAKRPVANPKNPCGFLLCEASTLPTPYASSNRICRTSLAAPSIACPPPREVKIGIGQFTCYKPRQSMSSRHRGLKNRFLLKLLV